MHFRHAPSSGRLRSSRVIPATAVLARVVPATAILAVVGALLTPFVARAQTPDAGEAGGPRIEVETAPRPSAMARRVTESFAIDGELEERAWADAEPLTNFVQSRPDTGAPASERTVVRFAYDEDALYISALCYDSEPELLVVPSLKQDFSSGSSDVFGVTLDTYQDRRNGFMFLVNPRGALKDVQIFDDSRSEDQAWEGPIRVASVVHDSGWTVEMAIPFSTLRFHRVEGEQVWGLNVLRRIRRKAEDAFWAPLDRRNQIHKMSRAGTLRGLRDLRPGRNFRIKPFVVTDNTSGALLDPDDRGSRIDGGADLKLGLTSGLTLDLTYRTDFAQIEVDQEQINLTRFPLFFPEKRDFFVENSGTFAFGDQSERSYRTGVSLRDFTLFHSRRIGLTGDGEPIPIVGGGRLSGRAGGFELGVLNLQTESTDGVPGENFTVLRGRRSVGRSDFGAIFVNRDATGSVVEGHPDYNRSWGVDANIRPVPSLLLAPYLAMTDAPGADGNELAARMWAGWRDPLWDVSAFFRHIGDDFNPSVGFVRRRDIRQSFATVGLHPRPPIGGVQEVNPYLTLDYVTDLDGTVVTRTRTAGFDVSFEDGGRLALRYDNRFERLLEPFEVASEVEIPIGGYGFDEGSISYSLSPGRALTGSVALSGGGFFDGTRRTVSASVLWKPDYHLSLDGSVSYNDISLPGGDFTADVYGVRADYGFSTKVFLSAFFQYNAAV
ncbi:MAG: carbohydrate binding family 9 domain-containing protein, partial [Gemmatimonadetes bacterium]|nr:carbohydrate binding family 9 domain-containing protein [Gemmatimonadota bacterium]